MYALAVAAALLFAFMPARAWALGRDVELGGMQQDVRYIEVADLILRPDAFDRKLPAFLRDMILFPDRIAVFDAGEDQDFELLPKSPHQGFVRDWICARNCMAALSDRPAIRAINWWYVRKHFGKALVWVGNSDARHDSVAKGGRLPIVFPRNLNPLRRAGAMRFLKARSPGMNVSAHTDVGLALRFLESFRSDIGRAARFNRVGFGVFGGPLGEERSSDGRKQSQQPNRRAPSFNPSLDSRVSRLSFGGYRRTSRLYEAISGFAMLFLGVCAGVGFALSQPSRQRIDSRWLAFSAASAVGSGLFLIAAITGKIWLFGL